MRTRYPQKATDWRTRPRENRDYKTQEERPADEGLLSTFRHSMTDDIDISWSFLGQHKSTHFVLDVPPNASPQTPLIILLHGTSGTIDDMSNPAGHPGYNYERILPGTIVDRGWHALPNIGFWALGPDGIIDVTGWAPFLAGAGFPTINYAQIGPRDLLVEPIAELRALLDAIDTDIRFEAVRDRRIVLLGHSRGGILARMVLVDMAVTGSPILARITTCITLHAPNQGSTLANTALGLAAIVGSWRVTGIPLVPPELQKVALRALDGVITLIVDEAGAPAYADFAVGSPTLLLLAAAEPVPGVTYFTFGGTRPVLLTIRGWAFTPESTILLPHLPPFHWSTSYVPLVPAPPAGLLPFPELLEGGDVLTNSVATRLPFAFHRDNYINHAEALWDSALQIQVLAILNQSPLSQTLIVENAASDGADPDRAIDAIGGTGPTGSPWKLTLGEALAMADAGTAFFVHGREGGMVPVQRVRRRNGHRYLRAAPGWKGVRLSDLPPFPD
jgi:predicted esterase